MARWFTICLILSFCVTSSAKNCLEELVRIGMVTGREDRTAKEVSRFRSIKNRPITRPRRIDLSRAQEEPSRALIQAFGDSFMGYLGLPSKYEKKILELRKGDEVLFDGKLYRLGEFLGAGNTTHVFRLVDFPNKVIRIPLALPETFPLMVADPKRPETHQTDRILNHFQWTLKWVEHSVKKKGVIPVHFVDPLGRFMIVDLVPNAEEGNTFLSRIVHRTSGRLFYPQSFQNLSSTDKERLESLVELMIDNADVREVERDGELLWEIDRVKADQYLFDGDRQRWWLVDPESF